MYVLKPQEACSFKPSPRRRSLSRPVFVGKVHLCERATSPHLGFTRDPDTSNHCTETTHILHYARHDADARSPLVRRPVVELTPKSPRLIPSVGDSFVYEASGDEDLTCKGNAEGLGVGFSSTATAAIRPDAPRPLESRPFLRRAKSPTVEVPEHADIAMDQSCPHKSDDEEERNSACQTCEIEKDIAKVLPVEARSKYSSVSRGSSSLSPRPFRYKSATVGASRRNSNVLRENGITAEGTCLLKVAGEKRKDSLCQPCECSDIEHDTVMTVSSGKVLSTDALTCASPSPLSLRRCASPSSRCTSSRRHSSPSPCRLIDARERDANNRRRSVDFSSVSPRGPSLEPLNACHKASKRVTSRELFARIVDASGNARLYMIDLFDAFDHCRRTGLNLQLARWVEQSAYQSVERAEDISSSMFHHFLKALVADPYCELDDAKVRSECENLSLEDAQGGELAELRRSMNKDVRTVSFQVFQQLLSRLSLSMCVDEHLLVTHFMWSITGYFDLPQSLYMEMLEVVAHKSPSGLISEEFTPNDFVRFLNNSGFLAHLTHSAFHGIFSRTVQDMSILLSNKAKQRLGGWHRAKQDHAKRKSLAVPQRLVIVGKDEFSVLMAELFIILRKDPEPRSPLQMCVMMLAAAKSKRLIR